MIRTRSPLAFLLSLALGALCLRADAAAQETETDPEAQQPPAETAQEPQEKEQEQPKKLPAEPQDPVAAARQELEAVRAELEFVRGVAEQGVLTRVRHLYFGDRELQSQSIDLGIAVPNPAGVPGVHPPKQVGVRLMNQQELEQAADDVVFLVDGQPVTKAEYDTMLAHLLSDPGDSSREALEKEAVKSLVLQKAALAAFEEQAPEARAEIERIQQTLEEGADFAELARSESQCPTAAQGGDLSYFPRGTMDPVFERVARETPVGEVSGIVQSAHGYHLIKVTDRELGDQPGQIRRVRARHILVMFDEDAQQVRDVMNRADRGQVDLAFVNADWREKSPF